MKRGLLLSALLLATPAQAEVPPGFELATFFMKIGPAQEIEIRAVPLPDWACRQYVDYSRSHGAFELIFDEPLAKTDAPVTGMVDYVMCVRQDGTGYDWKGERDVPKFERTK